MPDHAKQLEQFWDKIMFMRPDQRYRYASHWSWLISEARQNNVDIPPEYDALRRELDDEAAEAQFDNMPV